ncbi:MAG: proton-conducting transporter membrane subunit [candidate division WOR-3 bacterium]
MLIAQWLPIFVVLPLFSAFFIYLFGSIFKKQARSFSDIFANFITGILFLLSILALTEIARPNRSLYFMGGWRPPLGILLVLDGLSALILLVITFIGFMATIFSINYMEKFTAKHKFYALLFLMITGMIGVTLTGDLFNLFVFLEIATIASYALVSFGTGQEELEAGFKYMVMGEIGSLTILLSIALLYAATGSLNMADISRLITGNGTKPFVLFSSVLFLIGFGIKAALIPFHAWLPDAHPSAPAPISALLSGVLIKVLGVYALVRVFFNVFGMNPIVANILLFLAGLSMLIGVILQLGQNDIKRLLAYCSISQVGYILLGFGLGTPLGIMGGLFHLLNHAVFKSLLFFNSGAIEYATGTRRMEKLGGLLGKMPLTGVSAFIGTFAASGVPPFNGFWSKLILILAAIAAKQYLLAGIAGLAAILTLASFIRMQRRVFLGNRPENLNGIREVPIGMTSPLILLSILSLLSGVLILPGLRNIFLDLAQQAVLYGTNYANMIFGQGGF